MGISRVIFLSNSSNNFIFSLTRLCLFRLIATASGDDSICLLRLNGSNISDCSLEKIVEIPHAHSSDVNSLSWNPVDPELLASCSDDGSIAIWKLPIS